MLNDFHDTSVAFAYKTDADLKKSYWLFKLLSSPALVRMGGKLAPLSIKAGLGSFIKKTIYRQFVGGETVEDCIPVLEMLYRYRIGSILDYSVEGKESEDDFERCLNESLKNIEFASGREEIPFCVFKVTGLAPLSLLEKVSAGKALNSTESAQWSKVKSRVKALCKKAYECKVPLLIDAEESWIQQAIDDLAIEYMIEFNKETAIIYNTYQLYRHDRLEFFKKQNETCKQHGAKLGAKLVRGAYMEKERKRAEELGYPSPIQPDKASTDRDYNLALEYGVQDPNVFLVAGTHNEESTLLLCRLMEQNAIPNDDKRFWFSQLFGMSDHISFNLAKNGYNVVKYLPYGPVKDVLPYLIRRAQENTSVKGQTGRELELIIKELKRRKK
ncbi:MAG: proline dehydrogenase family protein [Bacteroidia bacterium]|nr:proline dehydrogenase family protein [Bacteroidia bacterium]